MERSNYQGPSPIVEGGAAAEREFYKVQIIGDGRFTKRTQRALRLLEDRAPDYYDIVRGNIGIIQQVAEWHAGMLAWEPLPIFLVTNEDTRNKTWYAGGMVHDAWHSLLYHQWLKTHPGESEVPDDAWRGSVVEEQCLQKQYEALVQLKAPRHILKYVREDAIKTGYWNAPMHARGTMAKGQSNAGDESVNEIIRKKQEEKETRA